MRVALVFSAAAVAALYWWLSALLERLGG